MLARSTKALPSWATPAYLKKLSTQSVSGALFARDTVGGLIATTRVSILFSGILAIIGLSTMIIKPDLVYKLQSLPLFASSAPQQAATLPATQVASTISNLANVPANAAAKNIASLTVPAPSANVNHLLHMDGLANKAIKPLDSSRQQQWVTNWLSKRYRVAGDATNMFVTTAYKTARETKLDPLLILAVMAIESGLNPFAESPVGAQGLMQVMSKVHEDKFESMGGIKAALNPTANIKVGSMILRDYVNQGGSVEAGLKRYVGAAAFANDGGYGYKVLAEYRRLQDVAIGKNVPSTGSVAPIATPKAHPIQAVAPADAASPTPAEAAVNVPDPIERRIQQSDNQLTPLPLT
ncbi:Soluble lytic murein transglycosylase-related regulatory proteins [Collimonas arenae]|uniref:Soluble lytic murein transglycosylase-related regulatory proteins n=1 Tax=Collimonas arenae TaxID=279058 RepID=A0A0A1FG95_9BURK|nr:transglycosylase SLT domain-containing protein [Collimonas arenae]AIY42684.1 Soluble lytic murein transglycosylase-related regulatory proteins [Collimonas arenae]